MKEFALLLIAAVLFVCAMELDSIASRLTTVHVVVHGGCK